MTPIILNLAVVLASGWLFRRFGVVDENAEKAFTRYLYYLALPSLIVVKIAGTPVSGFGWRFLAANALPPVVLMAAAWGAWRAGLADWRFARLLIIVPALGNTAYLGFPVASMRLGGGAIGYAAVSASLQNVLVFTFGFALMTTVSGGERPPARFLRRLGSNVVLWASLGGLAVSASGLRLPALVLGVLSDVGRTTLPIALFTIGVSLYGKRIAHNLRRILLISGLKLLALPVIYLACARLVGFSGLASRVGFIEMAVPVAVLNYIVAREFEFDAELVGQSIVFSTLAFFPLLYLYDWALVRFL